ncbi:MAG: sugar kinase, partial [Clostridia bacterium]|nr:sugar kinase [Clostridia bacterium]
MLLIVGTVPLPDLPLITGPVAADGQSLVIDGHALPCTQGTTAMVNAALVTSKHLGLEAPQVLLAGDIGSGQGSRQIYRYLIENLGRLAPQVLALHYCLPDIQLMRELIDTIDRLSARPTLVADAGAMYAAKAAGLAFRFDVLTPDATEMAFLADPEAVHPAYINQHLFDTDIGQVPQLIDQAYRQKGAARVLLVKGAIDHIAKDGQILASIGEPNLPVLECIGGTGDTITGMVAALVHGELAPEAAARLAARANRAAGQRARPTPATRIDRIIEEIPGALAQCLPTIGSAQGL